MKFTPFSLQGKHLLITGASSGIGRSTAVLCSQMGAKLSIVGRSKERLSETASLLDGNNHQEFITEMTDDESVAALVASLEKIDGVVHCTGTQQACIAKMLTRKAIDEVFETNLYSVANLNQKLLASKKINKGASIVIVSSVAANLVAEVGNAAYSASKGALSSYARVLAIELAPRKIRVNTITPGIVRTPLLEKFGLTAEQWEEDEKKYPLGYGEPQDVANSAVYLLSDASKWLTGTNILLDGGLTLH